MKDRYKIQRKVKEHHRKARREARRSLKSGSSGLRKKSDPGIPNLFPFKAQLLRQMEAQKHRMDQGRKDAEEKRRLAAEATLSVSHPLRTGMALRVHGPFCDVLPQSPEVLRTYNPSPVFLKPHHCMLCEEEFDSQEQLDAHTQVAHKVFQCSCGEEFPDDVSLRQHLSAHETEGEPAEHGPREDTTTYRQKVFAQVICNWPTAVTAQVHRARLYAMIMTTTFNLGFSACASCAMEKKNSEMVRFTFPRPDEEGLPDR